MNKRQEKLMFFYQIIGVLAVAVTIFLAAKVNIPSREYTSFLDGWVNESGDTVNLTKIKEDTVVTKEINDIPEEKTVVINAQSVLIDVYLDDELVYETDRSSSDFLGKTPGTYYINIELDPMDNGKTMKLVIDTPYKNIVGTGKILTMSIGSGVSIYKYLLSRKIISTGVCFALIVLGMFMIFVYKPLKKEHMVDKEMIYLAQFSLAVGIFMTTDTSILQMIFGNEYIFHTITQLWMMFVVPPLLLYVSKTYNVKNYLICNLINALCLIDVIAISILSLSGVADIHELMWIIHSSYVLGTIYIMVIVHTHKIDKKEAFWHILAVVSLIFGSFADLGLMYFGSYKDTTEFTRIGVLIFILIEIFNILVKYFKNMKIATKNEVLSKLAYQDGLTELLNRTSFNEAIEYNDNNNIKATYIMFDVNNLKKVNDTYGHADGDYLIIQSGKAIDINFNMLGKVYRIGGDEFAVIVSPEITKTEIEHQQDEMIKYLKELNSKNNKPYDINIASGFAIATQKHKTNSDTLKEADKKMYKNKAKMKSKSQ